MQVDFSPSPAPFAANLEKVHRIAVLRRDGIWVLNDFKDLRGNLNVEVLFLYQLFMTSFNLFSDPLREFLANHRVADVDDPLDDKRTKFMDTEEQ